MSNAATKRHLVWVTFSLKEKRAFLEDHRNIIMESALEAMVEISTNGGLCLVCVVEAFNKDPKIIQNRNTMQRIINTSTGST